MNENGLFLENGMRQGTNVFRDFFKIQQSFSISITNIAFQMISDIEGFLLIIQIAV